VKGSNCALAAALDASLMASASATPIWVASASVRPLSTSSTIVTRVSNARSSAVAWAGTLPVRAE